MTLQIMIITFHVRCLAMEDEIYDPRMIHVCPGVTLSIYNRSGYIY